MSSDSGVVISKRLREWRSLVGITQERFSERAGLGIKYFQSLEQGKKIDVRLSTIQKLAKAFGVEAWEFLKPDSKPRVMIRATKN